MKISISSKPFKWFRNYFSRVEAKRAPTVVKVIFYEQVNGEKNHLEIKVERKKKKTSQKSYEADLPKKQALKLRFSPHDLSVQCSLLQKFMDKRCSKFFYCVWAFLVWS